MGVLERAQRFAYWRAKRVKARVKQFNENRFASRRLKKHWLEFDPSIHYPSYLSMDEWIDVDRLRGLDEEVTKTSAELLAEDGGMPFDAGALYKGRIFKARRPGSRMLHLTSTETPFRYYDLDKCELWKPTPLTERFPGLMDFVETLPFADVSRIVIMCDEKGRSVTTHRDHAYAAILHEFMWFRTNMSKPFFVTDRHLKQRAYIKSYSAWFDTVNQFHGADAGDEMTISLRIDGRFNDEFRKAMPTPPTNPASTPSYWACAKEQAASD